MYSFTTFGFQAVGRPLNRRHAASSHHGLDQRGRRDRMFNV